MKPKEMANDLSFATLLCWFASFPYAAYASMLDRRQRVAVLARGMAVLLGPTASTIALAKHGAAVFNNAAFIYLLPPMAVLVDMLLVASSYERKQNAGLRVARAGICLISLLLAGYAALLGEKQSLAMSLRAQEVQSFLSGQSPATREYFGYEDVIGRKREAIALIEKELSKLPDLQSRMAVQDHLADRECNGPAATADPLTGRRIVGGSCGPRARSHQAAATALRSEIARIQAMAPGIKALEKEMIDAKALQTALLDKQLSKTDSMGDLLKALPYAPLGNVVSAAASLLLLLFIDAAALWISATAVHDNLRTAVVNVASVDRQRLALLHEAQLREVHGDRETVFLVEDEHPVKDVLTVDPSDPHEDVSVIPISRAVKGAQA